MKQLESADLHLSAGFASALDFETNVVVVLDAQGIVRFLNRAWTESARRDCAQGCLPEEVLGRRYLDFVTGDLKPYFAAAFERAGRLGPGLASVWLESECSTPETFRKLTTRISLLRMEGQGKRGVGYIVHNELRALGPMAERHRLVEASADSLRDAEGILRQCSCCRRVRQPKTGRWAMCVSLLTAPAQLTSHGLCELCLGTYYS